MKAALIYVLIMAGCAYSLSNSIDTVLDKAEEQRIARMVSK